MTFTRDSVIWWIGIIASLVGIVLAQADALGLPPKWKVILTVALSFLGTVSGKMASSPRPISPEGYAKEVQDHNEAVDKAVTKVQELAKAPPLPPVVLVLLLLLLPTLAHAQIGTEPLAWTPEHRALADGISSALVVIQAGGTVYHDVKSWRDGDRKPTYRSGCSIGIALALTETLKRAFPEVRPDGSDNKSGFSGHSAASMALSGWRYEFGVPISVMTGLFRDSANKHHLWGPGQAKDIPFGWFIGAGAQAICSAVIR